MKFKPVAVMATVLMLGNAGVAGAQAQRSYLGPHVGYNLDNEEFLVGMQLTTPIGRYVEFYPSFDYYLVDAGTLWTVSLDMKVRPAGQSASWLYLGGGMDVTRRAVGNFDNNDTGLNLLAGFDPAVGRVRPFGELRFTLSDQTTSRFMMGLNFALGR